MSCGLYKGRPTQLHWQYAHLQKKTFCKIDRQGGGQNAKELSVSAPLISTHDWYYYLLCSDRAIHQQTTAAALASL